jgi:hypothetical protein
MNQSAIELFDTLQDRIQKTQAVMNNNPYL